MDRRSFTTFLVSALSCWAGRAVSEETESSAGGAGRPSPTLPTLGGKQFWSDELFFHGWHIQRNSLTGHYRLLDERNHRHTWGTLTECQNKLAEIRRRDQVPAMHGPAVIVMHGLGRSASSMAKMAQFLRGTYPTTRGSIAEHAQSLAGIVRGLDGIDEIHFVAHSLGNLVIRHYLADQTEPSTGRSPDPRIKRIVMLGAPNNGARLAEVLVRSGVEYVIGKSAVEIRDFQQLESHLCTPACEFGIIAGGRGGPTGYNPWLAGDNDLVVSVETTRLPGASDFALLPVIHTLMMDDKTVQQYTLQFFEHGYFISPERRQPIPKAAE
jgi:pimeloyl-ACP methyl ester carboxylesterase